MAEAAPAAAAVHADERLEAQVTNTHLLQFIDMATFKLYCILKIGKCTYVFSPAPGRLLQQLGRPQVGQQRRGESPKSFSKMML